MNTLITNSEELIALTNKVSNFDKIGIDYQTTSYYTDNRSCSCIDKMKFVGFGLGLPDGSKFYCPLGHNKGYNIYDSVDLLKKIFNDKNKIVWSHDVKFSSIVTKNIGIESNVTWRDSKIACWLLGYGVGRNLKLRELLRSIFDIGVVEYSEIIPMKQRAHEVNPQVMASYSSNMALWSLMLGERMIPELIKFEINKVFTDIECPIASEVLPHINEVGIGIDKNLLVKLREYLINENNRITEVFESIVGVDISCNQSVSSKLIDELKWWKLPSNIRRGRSGYYSINRDNRKLISRELDKKSLPYRVMHYKNTFEKYKKIINTFTTGLVKKAEFNDDGRIRADCSQTDVVTGRLAFSNPALQQIPIRSKVGSKIRKAFIPDEGWTFFDADYSCADLRMIAYLSKDPAMIDVLSYVDNDLHLKTSQECDCSRDEGKKANLSLIYEATPKTLSRLLNIPIGRSCDIYGKWHKTYPGVKEYHKRVHKFAKEYGYIRTITGRIIYINGFDSSNIQERLKAERCASNYPGQGSVADVMKIAMRNLIRDWKDRGVLYDYYKKTGKAKLNLNVHDELLVELRNDFIDEGSNDVVRHMSDALNLCVPLEVSGGFGKNWLEAHS